MFSPQSPPPPAPTAPFELDSPWWSESSTTTSKRPPDYQLWFDSSSPNGRPRTNGPGDSEDDDEGYEEDDTFDPDSWGV